MRRSLISSTIIAIALPCVSASLTNARSILCKHPSQPLLALSQPQQLTTHWLNIDWPQLIRGADIRTSLTYQSEWICILSALALTFSCLLWLQHRLNTVPQLTRQSISRISILLLFLLFIIALLSYLSAQSLEQSAYNLLCHSLNLLPPEHPHTPGFTYLQQATTRTSDLLMQLGASGAKVSGEWEGGLVGLARESMLGVNLAQELLYSMHFYPALMLGKLQEYMQPQHLLLSLKIYQQLALLTAVSALLALFSGCLPTRPHQTKFIKCLAVLAGSAMILGLVGLGGLPVGSSVCSTLASYPLKSEFVKLLPLVDRKMQEVLVELVSSGEMGRSLADPAYHSLLQLARQTLGELPVNSTSPLQAELRLRLVEVLEDSTSGFPTIPFTALGDYLKLTEAAACRSLLPTWYTAICWQIATAVTVILFLASLLYSKKPIDHKEASEPIPADTAADQF